MTLKSIILGLICILIMTASALVWAKYTRTLLVLDMRNAPQLPRNFRATSNTLPSEINLAGLSDLHIAGGGQFSKAAYDKILQRLGTKKITVIDLREESHGMLNGNAVSWYGPRDATNAGKSPSQIIEEQSTLLVDLGKEEIAVVNKILKKSDDGKIETVKPIEYVVHQTSTEEELVTSKGHQYKRLFVQDFHAPSKKETDRFIEIVKELPKNKWIYFHCRAGVGRTTVFMTMYDIMHNAKQVSLTDIFARQIALGGKDFTKLPEKNHFKYQWAVERLDFLKQFYQYAHDNHDNFNTSWTQWLQSSNNKVK